MTGGLFDTKADRSIWAAHRRGAQGDLS